MKRQLEIKSKCLSKRKKTKIAFESSSDSEPDQHIEVNDNIFELVKRQAKYDMEHITGKELEKPLNNAEDEDQIDIVDLAQSLKKNKSIQEIDHSTMNYDKIQKKFYQESKEIEEMTAEEVSEYRSQLDGINVRGKRCPKPIKTWEQAGLPHACFRVIVEELKFAKPTPIQCQALPIALSGRDIIGIAKTGSGKSLAFLLPLFRHVMAQKPIEVGDGPIGIILAPTRELANQIYKECKNFTRSHNINAVCAYGGSNIAANISDLKKVTHILVSTPGRMIDLMTAGSGKILSLNRVTYFVLDEADRMFDLGFEPQVMRIVRNVRPDAQKLLFSATFPRQMNSLARKILIRPIQVVVGGLSVVCNDVALHVEVFYEEERKWWRLLQVLGEEFKKNPNSRVLVFVDRQESCEYLLGELFKRGYCSMSLHGSKDQSERDSVITDFKCGNIPIVIATSVAARGLDVKGLNLVVNYDCPNHYEDMVHRCGRTGRAGNKGVAYTFITREQEQYAPEIARALSASKTPIPDDLQKLVDAFQQKYQNGEVSKPNSGFSGKGLDRIEHQREEVKKVQKGMTHNEESSESENEQIAEIYKSNKKSSSNQKQQEDEEIFLLEETAYRTAIQLTDPYNTLVPTSKGPMRGIDYIKMAEEKMKKMFSSGKVIKIRTTDSAYMYKTEVEINDYPAKTRFRLTSKEQLNAFHELSGAVVTVRGRYYPAGYRPRRNEEKKLFIGIESGSFDFVEKARNEIMKELSDAASEPIEFGQGNRYSVT
eukprot:NODE_274_length_12130_cov_0.238800.p2 type:complete len:766 gc:universal NODE_274_length_12130_cov_0.238800:9324-11621(+)